MNLDFLKESLLIVDFFEESLANIEFLKESIPTMDGRTGGRTGRKTLKVSKPKRRAAKFQTKSRA